MSVKGRSDVETACTAPVNHSTPALKHTLLYGLFNSKWIIVYKVYIIVYITLY